jgi:double-stranded uracil-DNA glycosylase
VVVAAAEVADSVPGEAPASDESTRLDCLPVHLPLSLAHIHRRLRPGQHAELRITSGSVPPAGLDDALHGAGFSLASLRRTRAHLNVTVERLHTLPDTVSAAMRVLVCGLTPSLHAAERGIGYAGPGNRFWPAAVAAGLVSRPLDPVAALVEDAVGMTDLVKRATGRAADLTTDEYRVGLRRVDVLVDWLQPRVVTIIGLDGWRRAVDRRAAPGVQDRQLGGRPVVLMPSTSGLNTHVGMGELVEHLRATATLADASAGAIHPESIRSEP